MQKVVWEGTSPSSLLQFPSPSPPLQTPPLLSLRPPFPSLPLLSLRSKPLIVANGSGSTLAPPAGLGCARPPTVFDEFQAKNLVSCCKTHRHTVQSYAKSDT